MERWCACCQERSTHQEVVTMRCPDGTAIQHVYTQVDKCVCTPSCLPSPTAPTDTLV